MFKPIPFMEECRRRYGPVFSIRLGSARNIVVVGDPALAMDVLGGDPEVYDSGQANLLFRPVLGQYSLLLLDGEPHMRHRRIMLPRFRPGHVQNYARVIEEAANRSIESWPMEKQFTLASQMEKITYEAITRVTFGDEADQRLDELGELIPVMMDRCDSVFTLLPPLRAQWGGLSPYARLLRIVDQIDGLLLPLIEERAEDPLHQLREDVLSTLLSATYDDGSPLSRREIRDELLTLVMAGYETTTAALTWAFERLLREPRALDRLRSEIDAGEEEYLDAVVKESLRARPAVPIVARKVRAPVELGGYAFPEGTVLMVAVYLVHSDPSVYPEPEKFRPERFLGGKPDARAWIPFGGGVRRCLGANFAQLEMKVVLRTVLKQLDLSTRDTAPEKSVRRRFTFAPGNDGSVVARPRRDQGSRFRPPARRGVAAPGAART